MEEPTKCPYREICKCPGHDQDEGDWIPIDGFRVVPEGILCIDWDTVVTSSQLANLRREGRTTFNVEAAEKIDAARRKYGKSKKRKDAQNRYEDTEKGQATLERHIHSEKFKLTQQKYYYSDKGQEAHKRQKDQVKLFREYNNWLEDHPGKSMDDFLKEKPE